MRKIMRTAQRFSVVLLLCYLVIGKGALAEPVASIVVSDRQEPLNWQSMIAELRFNQRPLADYVDVMLTTEGDLLVAAEPLFWAGEATVLQHDTQQWEFTVASLGARLIVDFAQQRLMSGNETRILTERDAQIVFGSPLVSKAILEELFGLSIEYDPQAMVVNINSHRPWPIDVRLARELRWRRLSAGESELPPAEPVVDPYQFWGAPQFNLNLSSSHSGTAQSRSLVGLQGVVEAGYMTNRFSMSGTLTGGVQSARLISGRTDARGGLLGLDSLYAFDIGDVSGFSVPLARGSGNGAGVVLRGTPLTVPDNFDITFVEGDAPLGWDAELYLGGRIYDFQRVGDDGYYRFDNVPLEFGENSIVVKLYGPAGEQREVDFSQRVGTRLRPGEIHWQAHVGRPQRDLFELHDVERQRPDAWTSSFKARVGISRRLDVGMSFARAAVIDDTATTHTADFYGLNMTQTLFDRPINLNYAVQDNGTSAYSVRTSMPLGEFSMGLSYEHYDRGFNGLAGSDSVTYGSRFAIRTAIPLTALGIAGRPSISHEQTERFDGSRLVVQELGFGHRFWGVQVGHDVNRRFEENIGGGHTEQMRYRMLSSYNHNLWDFRSELNYVLKPLSEFQSINFIANRRLNDYQHFSTSITYNGDTFGYGVNYSHQFETFSLSVGAGYGAGDWNLSVGIRIAFAHIPGLGWHSEPNYNLEGGMALITAKERSQVGVYRAVDGLQILVNQRRSESLTDGSGRLLMQNLDTTSPTRLQLARHSLPDPFMVPTHGDLELRARPGHAIKVPLELVEATQIMGYAKRQVEGDRWQPVRRITLQLLDARGFVRAETKTLDDGYYEFNEAHAGQWSIRVKPEQPNIHEALHSMPFAVDIAAGELLIEDVDLLFYLQQPVEYH